MNVARILVYFLIAIAEMGMHARIAISEEERERESAFQQLRNEFSQQIAPLVRAYCIDCHGDDEGEAELSLAGYRDLADVIKSHRVWASVLDRVAKGDMPPEDADDKPTDAQRYTITSWIERVREMEAMRNAGDPGPVIARRLSNAEFDYSIRDLTGVDIRPTSTFPVDPANEAGFDNTGESLTMSPALMTKYLEATRNVIDHLLLTPRGFVFAPFPVVTDTDRDKYCVKQIVDFYQLQPTDLSAYFLAAWRYRYCDRLGQPNFLLEEIALEEGISSKYLQTVWEALTQSESQGPLAKLQSIWESMPEPMPEDNLLHDAREASERMRDFVIKARSRFVTPIENLTIKGSNGGSQPLVLWKNKQYAKYRRQANLSLFEDKDFDLSNDEIFENSEETDREKLKLACEQFCSLFPDAFYIVERGRDYLSGKKVNPDEAKGRFLSAGFHSMTGYFRDDRPLYDMLLDPIQQQELDALWDQLTFCSETPQRQYQGFLWFEKAESRFMRDSFFDTVRSEDATSWSPSMIEQVAEVYLKKAIDTDADEVTQQAIKDYFIEINDQIQWVEQTRVTSQACQLEAVLDFASRAYRRPLSPSDGQELREFYRRLVEEDGLTHEQAIQDVVVSILMSPRFCYRLDLLGDSDETRPLDPYELASRLSYFLWSSIPDDELLAHAAVGDLVRPEVLAMQTQRMLQDARARSLATEFAGNWLDFRRFEEHNAVDRGRFSSFDDQLRSAMFEEPIQYLLDVFENDRSVLDLLNADRTFVNASLAKHYGMNDVSFTGTEWKMVEDAGRYGRGGLLPMAVFLTKNAPGLRTSPVKRGYWVVRRLLGERIPAPPPNVPEIPADESQLGELTLRETLAKHREHASCSGCHDRIDSIGLVFEGFGPIGERRSVDLGGRKVDASAIFPDGSERSGVEDLRRYVKENREADFIDNFCRKLLSYALGRSLQLSDESLLNSMRTQTQADNYRIGDIVNAIVSSPPFLYKRGREFQSAPFPHDLNPPASSSSLPLESVP